MRDTIIIILTSIAAGIILASIYWSQKKPPAPAIQYRDKIVEKVVEKRDVVTKTIKGADGSTTIVVTDRTVVEEAKTSDHKLESKPSALPQYSLRIGAKLHLDDVLKRDYEVAIGRRLFGPTWLELGFSTDKTVTAGLIYTF
jgi:hypothetical protein